MRNDYQKAVDNNFNVQNTQGVEVNALEQKRLDSNYTCKDQNWHTGKYSGDIYISTPNDTHKEILKHHTNSKYKIPESGYPGTSGFFTDENTASKHFTSDGMFDSVGLGHDLQQAPYHDATKASEAKINKIQYNPEYNGNLDCFRVNESKMLENYGTTDFYAAQSRCVENTAWGNGGGFQGYNSYINEMINNGSLEYVPEKSKTCSNNECLDYATRKGQAGQEASAVNDYIERNGIKGESGERIGYNELSQSNLQQNERLANGKREYGLSSKNIESVGGGGANAPNKKVRGNTDNPPVDKKSSQERGTPQNTENAQTHSETETNGMFGNNNNEPDNLQNAESQVRGNIENNFEELNSDIDDADQSEVSKLANESESTKNGQLAEDAAGKEAKQAKGATNNVGKSNLENGPAKRPAKNAVSQTGEDAAKKAAEEASKRATEEAVKNTVPKNTGMGV